MVPEDRARGIDKEILQKLVDAGLGSLPGGGAEIFHPEVREEICGAKASTDVWLDVHRTAHKLGLHSNATMLYGHIDKAKHRIDHLIRLRELQDETGGFQTFIPLAFHPDNSRMDEIPKPSGMMDLKTMAISRLMLDNFPHIKAYWVMLGIKTAQVALAFGADDIDGTVVHEKIYHEAGAETPQEVTVNEIRRLIAEAGRIPVERDTLYHRVERDGSPGRRGPTSTSRRSRSRGADRPGAGFRLAKGRPRAYNPADRRRLRKLPIPAGSEGGAMDLDFDELRPRYRLCRAGFGLMALSLGLLCLSNVCVSAYGITRNEGIRKKSSRAIGGTGSSGRATAGRAFLGSYLLWGRWKEPVWQSRAGALVLLNFLDLITWGIDHSAQLGLAPDNRGLAPLAPAHPDERIRLDRALSGGEPGERPDPPPRPSAPGVRPRPPRRSG